MRGDLWLMLAVLLLTLSIFLASVSVVAGFRRAAPAWVIASSVLSLISLFAAFSCYWTSNIHISSRPFLGFQPQSDFVMGLAWAGILASRFASETHLRVMKQQPKGNRAASVWSGLAAAMAGVTIYWFVVASVGAFGLYIPVLTYLIVGTVSVALMYAWFSLLFRLTSGISPLPAATAEYLRRLGYVCAIACALFLLVTQVYIRTFTRLHWDIALGDTEIFVLAIVFQAIVFGFQVTSEEKLKQLQRTA